MTPTRIYQRGSLVVEWRDYLCSHCGHCTRGLPTVFDTAKRPWVNLGGASDDAIRLQVADCPSGALTSREAA